MRRIIRPGENPYVRDVSGGSRLAAVRCSPTILPLLAANVAVQIRQLASRQRREIRGEIFDVGIRQRRWRSPP